MLEALHHVEEVIREGDHMVVEVEASRFVHNLAKLVTTPRRPSDQPGQTFDPKPDII